MIAIQPRFLAILSICALAAALPPFSDHEAQVGANLPRAISTPNGVPVSANVGRDGVPGGLPPTLPRVGGRQVPSLPSGLPPKLPPSGLPFGRRDQAPNLPTPAVATPAGLPSIPRGVNPVPTPDVAGPARLPARREMDEDITITPSVRSAMVRKRSSPPTEQVDVSGLPTGNVSAHPHARQLPETDAVPTILDAAGGPEIAAPAPGGSSNTAVNTNNVENTLGTNIFNNNNAVETDERKDEYGNSSNDAIVGSDGDIWHGNSQTNDDGKTTQDSTLAKGLIHMNKQSGRSEDDIVALPDGPTVHRHDESKQPGRRSDDDVVTIPGGPTVHRHDESKRAHH
ncbi:hypothetical protein K438DRAFT_2068381 [Mycena galopus ATCC 62051]|nr:hypothetical protein K438DRAFT_2068381 [Mycena galopus ATCC 62051]